VAGSDGSFHAVVPTPSGQSILTVSVTAGGHATGWTQQTVTGADTALSAGYDNAGITSCTPSTPNSPQASAHPPITPSSSASRTGWRPSIRRQQPP
jgi:hypothetical protein